MTKQNIKRLAIIGVLCVGFTAGSLFRLLLEWV